MDLNLTDFFDEADEILERFYQNLNNILNTFNRNLSNALYRDVHTLKGSAGLFGFKNIAEISHTMESILEPLRTGAIHPDEQLVDILLPGMDAIRGICDDLRKEEKESDKHQVMTSSVITAMVGQVSDFVHGEINPEIAYSFSDYFETESELKHFYERIKNNSRGVVSSQEKYEEEKKPDAIDQIPVGDVSGSEKDTSENSEKGPGPILESHIRSDEVKDMDSKSQISETSGSDQRESRDSGSQSINETLRVPVQILENLMNLVGELVLVRNQHMQYGTHSNDSELLNLNQRLNYVTAELQEEVMKTRMQKIGSILTKFNRVVRDLSKSLNKNCRLILDGVDTELDKTLLEAVKDPLMHIVRNAVDHGLETTEERVAAGKISEGKVEIRAYHEGGQVIIEITDDGKGLDPEKIINKALEKGVLKESDVEKMSDRDVFMLIFAPGFSTAEKISNVSGRGVGMDVVKTNIERIGGNIDLISVKGQGTTVKLRIPLTLAIIPALIVRSGAERFSIPQVKLVELVKIEKDENGVSKGIEELQGTQVYRLRGQLLPLINLNQILGIDSDGGSKDSESIVVLNADSGIFGLVVEEIEDSNDIVVKPLMQFLKDLSFYSGATIMGDGNIALTLDVTGLAIKSGIFSENEAKNSHHESDHEPSGHKTDITEYLLVDIGRNEKYAIPLCMVHRLEDFSNDLIKKTGEQEVVQYRNSLLPIFSVKKYLSIQSDTNEKSSENASRSVVVIQRSGKSYGLEVNRIVDVVCVSGDINSEIRDRKGILGNVIIDDDLVVVLDTMNIIIDMTSHFEKENNNTKKEIRSDRSKHNILLAEDNNFYRKFISDSLTQAGYHVFAACDGKEALEMAKKFPAKYSLLVSDIEMPEMGGCELAMSIKKDENITKFPMLAVSSKYNDKAIEEGLESGFNKYMEKLKMDELLETIDHYLNLAA
ncbi:MAG: chemotaxis protein CheW [Deltaproteobacteria bacterium]|nr:chemotaxis protein CheW [Deltaproteobacteria bacterium]